MVNLVSVDPANGEFVGEVEVTSADQVPAIVERAREAQSAWAGLGANRRARLLSQTAPVFESRAQELGRLLTREMGKPLKRAMGEVGAIGRGMPAVLAEIIEAVEPEIVENETTHSVIYHDPLGVCAAITPWNFPMSMPNWLVLPALAAGNTVVLKPSEETPLIGQAYADILNEVLPENVLQVVHGADDQGKALVASDVDLIAFTGSGEVGKKILAAAASRLKPVLLELGGKDPLLVLEDADLEKAASFAATSSFDNAGQACNSTERIYVPERVASRFIEHLVKAADEWATVGHGLDEATRIGPMINAGQRDHVLGQVAQAVEQGATVAYGGDGHLGNFVLPTVLIGIEPGMDIVEQETFGPVACVTVVADEEEAIRLANDSPFGLGAVIFGTDEDHARAVARRMNAGMVGINRGIMGAPGTPWVGARESGYGFHHSKDGHRQFTQTRVVSESK